MEKPAMPVGPVQHGRNGEYFIVVIQWLSLTRQ
jgi:hypothetical protein